MAETDITLASEGDVVDLGLHGLTGAVVTNSSAISSLKTSYNTLNDTVSKIKTDTADISGLTSDVKTLKTSYNTLNTTVGGLYSSITPIQSTLSSLSTKAAQLETSYNTLNTTVGSLKTSYNTLNTTVGRLYRSITPIESTVNTLSTKAAALETSYSTLFNTSYEMMMSIKELQELRSGAGFYASMASWSSLEPLPQGAGWGTIMPALLLQLYYWEYVDTAPTYYYRVLEHCSTYGQRLVTRDKGEYVNVIRTYDGFALNSITVNASGYLFAYSITIKVSPDDTWSIANSCTKHNLYSI